MTSSINSDIPQAFQNTPATRRCFLFDRAKWEKNHERIRNISLLGMIIVAIGEIIGANFLNPRDSYDTKVTFTAVFVSIMSIPTSIFFINLVLHLCCVPNHNRT